MTDTNKTVVQRNTNNPETQEEKSIPMMMRPAADIQENANGANIYIDLPGVSKDSLDIDVDQNVLTIKGAINLNTPENLDPSYMDVHAGIFERRFTLGEELDINNIEANLKQGELRLFIPRSEQHKPRKIEVKVA
jgi:HSP20 family molecular chaperone IbpA